MAVAKSRVGSVAPLVHFIIIESAGLQAGGASVPDIVTLDGRHISTHGIISGDRFKPVALEAADFRFGSAN